MGYRSEIIAGVPAERKEEALAIINEWDEVSETDDTFYMHAYEWKWYDAYDDVKKFNKFISKLEDEYQWTEHKPFLIGLGEPYEHDIYETSYIESPIKWKSWIIDK